MDNRSIKKLEADLLRAESDLINGKISEETIARVPGSHIERLKKHKIKAGAFICSYGRKSEFLG